MNLRKMNLSKLNIFKIIFIIGCLIVSTTITFAERTPEEKGFAIAARSDRLDRGFGDSIVDLKMVLRNAANQETTRTLRINTLEMQDESVGDKSLIIFDTPRDIKGTGLLSFDNSADFPFL